MASTDAGKIERFRAQARAHHGAGRFDQAEQSYRQILDAAPGDLEARHMMGVLRLQQDRAFEALQMLEPLLSVAPDHAEIRTHHALALQLLGKAEEALAGFDRALLLKPDNALTLLYRGNLLLEAGRGQDALSSYDRLLAVAPGYDEAWFRRGGALWLMERYEDALASYRKAMALNPGRFGAAFNSGTVLLKLERYDEAIAAFERAATIAPAHRYVLGAMAGAVSGACDFRRWSDVQRQVIAAVQNGNAVIAPLTFLPFCDDGMLRRSCSRAFAADQVPHAIAPLWTGERYRHQRIRLVYLSSDFHQHATSELIAGLIESHDRNRFEVSAISFSRDDASPLRARVAKAFDQFDDVRSLDDREVAGLLRKREIDIAVDLKGHTEGSRPGILARRPCPVQVNYLGYPGTMGASWLDYIIGDAVVLPFGDQEFYSEKIVHLPDCYQVNDARRVIAEVTTSRAEAGLPEKSFVFCCFNAAWKITPAIFEIWMRLLRALPDSVLWLLEDNPSMLEHLRSAATAHGVDAMRLIFAPRADPARHLARHRLADLFLDTLPYGAHTTASDALWAGLPLLTCLGQQFDGRVAASLLQTIGLPELVAHSLDEYESLALDLARAPERRAQLRARLAVNRLTSPLFDVERFREGIEAAYLKMIEISRSGGEPQGFAVSA